MRIEILIFVLCGILSAKGSPVETVVNSKVNEVLVDSIESDESSSFDEDSFEAVNEVQRNEDSSAAQPSVVVETIAIFHAKPTVTDVSRKIGPVELSLRNVVAASAVATEEIFLETTSMNAETLHMINSKLEILTANGMNSLFQPLNKVENEIKKTGDCGKKYENSLNMIFKDTEANLKECTRNLTYIDDRYKNKNLGTLHSLSIAGEQMNKLSESCELAQNFVVGTFCVINNLAEMNERVVADVNVVRQNTQLAFNETKEAIAAAEVCQQELVKKVEEKLNNLSKEIDEKCVKRKPESV